MDTTDTTQPPHNHILSRDVVVLIPGGPPRPLEMNVAKSVMYEATFRDAVKGLEPL